MPIRFRCVYCDKLLGIARRKAGAVVDCPHCAEKLIVPTPEPEVEAERFSAHEKGAEEAAGVGATSDGAKMNLFEHGDFDALMKSEPTFRAIGGGNAPAAPAYQGPPTDFSTDAEPPVLPAPAPVPAPPPKDFFRAEPPRPPGYFVSPSKATWLSVAAVILLALAFGAGLIVGRMIK